MTGTYDSQKKRVLKYMETNGSITPLDAMQLFGVMRLSAIIYDLRHSDGYNIETLKNDGVNRFGQATRYAVYILHPDAEENDEHE